MSKMYNVETMTLEQFKEIIASGNDEYRNQIRVSTSGDVYLSQGIVGAENLDGVAFRLETFEAGEDLVGEKASKDEEDMTLMYNAIKENWEKGAKRSYLDDWRIR